MSIVITFLIVDIAFGKIYDLINRQSIFNWGIGLFIVIAFTFVLGQYFILGFVKRKSKEIRTKEKTLNTMHKVVAIVQYVLAAIFVFVILQVVTTSHYNMAMLTASTTISYTLATTIMGLLSYQFFS